MPVITDRSDKEPLLQTRMISHGTLESADLVRTRRFYEEVLGFEVLQTSPISLMIRKGTNHTYAVVETGEAHNGVPAMHHNGFELESNEAVEQAHALLNEIKEEYGIGRINPITPQRGAYGFYFEDPDGNWWEVLATWGPKGYAMAFDDPTFDITGRHDLDLESYDHVGDPEVRARIAESMKP
jgi:catechol 2,3-dioxygenase-like lactoylglutathione lyase family enzyme